MASVVQSSDDGKNKNAPPEKIVKPSPSVADEWNANIFQIMTFSWLLPLIKVGYSRQLQENDVGENYSRDNVGQHLKRFEENLKEHS